MTCSNIILLIFDEEREIINGAILLDLIAAETRINPHGMLFREKVFDGQPIFVHVAHE